MSDLFADFFCGVPHFQLFYSRIYELSDLSEKKNKYFLSLLSRRPRGQAGQAFGFGL